MDKKIRIKDIAKLANVSIGTVDRVIHNRGEVSEQSRKKIMEILEKTGYKPNLLARTLGSNRTFRIGVLLPNPGQDEYWGLSHEGIRQSEEEWGSYGMIMDMHNFDLYDKESFKVHADRALAAAPDAVIAAPIFYQEAESFFTSCEKAGIPYVVVNNTIPNTKPLTFIGQDLYQSGRVGAELLHMHQSPGGTYAILHVYDDIHNSLHLFEKEKGFKDYFHERKGDPITVKSLDLNYTHAPTIEKELSELLADRNLKGVLVTTSKGASIVSKILQQNGKKGVRLVAYDLLKENLGYLNTGIIDFLINQNSRHQSFMGVSLLTNHLLFKRQPAPKYLFALDIITRENLKSYLGSSIGISTQVR
ncbi:MAG TPA: substrate-binding domain-containing protein [Chryseosolibacter sp.]|nr:substrate-binding domain-containing protein [Chryseosolibacter sp.]